MEYTLIDTIDSWIIERKYNDSNGIITCRAYKPGNSTWFSGNLRLDKNNKLIIPKGLNFNFKQNKETLKEVRYALKRCRRDHLYLIK